MAKIDNLNPEDAINALRAQGFDASQEATLLEFARRYTLEENGFDGSPGELAELIADDMRYEVAVQARLAMIDMFSNDQGKDLLDLVFSGPPEYQEEPEERRNFGEGLGGTQVASDQLFEGLKNIPGPPEDSEPSQPTPTQDPGDISGVTDPVELLNLHFARLKAQEAKENGD